MSEFYMGSQSGPTSHYPSDAASDLLWQRLTKAANGLYQSGDGRRAYEEYRRALREAERLLSLAGRGTGPTEAAMALLISHHNLAELALDMGQPDLATQHYQEAFDTLLTLAGLCSTPAALRQSCAANLKEATIALATHLQACGAPVSAITDTIRKARFMTNEEQDRSVTVKLA